MRWVAFCLCLVFWLAPPARPAGALANGDDIAWTAPPAEFVTSLYFAVLGRPPESRGLVVGWVGKIGNDPASRRQVFLDFLTTAEYRARFGDIDGGWRVYPSTGDDKRRFTAAESQPDGHGDAIDGPYREVIAQALAAYHGAFVTQAAATPAPAPAKAAGVCTAADVAGTYAASYGPIKCEAAGERRLHCCYYARCGYRLDLTVADDGRSVAGQWDHLDGRTGPAAFPLDESCALTSGEFGYEPGKLTRGWPVKRRAP